MILKRKCFSYDNRDRAVTNGYNVVVDEDNEDFEHWQGVVRKEHKAMRRFARIAGPGSIAGLTALAKKEHTGKTIAGYTALGAAAGGVLGEGWDAITNFDEKELEKDKELLDEYKKLPYRGYKGIDARENFRKEFLHLK